MTKEKENRGEMVEDAGSDSELTPSPTNPMSVTIPCDMYVWNEARRLVGDKRVRVEDLSLCIAQDPAIVLELLRVANAMYFSSGRPPITSIKTAIVRLGSDVVIETLEKIKERTRTSDEDVSALLESNRNRCKRTAIVARMFAESLAKQLADDCQTAGGLAPVGDLVAVIFFGRQYVELAEQHSRAGISFRLLQDHKFDVESVGVNYLKRAGIPDSITFALERDARPRSPERAILKPICNAALEMVDAFDLNKWEKLAPGKKLAPKSAIRLLQMTDSQYLKLYEKVSEFLFSIRLLDERKKQEAERMERQEAQEIHEERAEEREDDLLSLDDEIESLIQGTASAEDSDSEVEEDVAVPHLAPKPQEPTEIVTLNANLASERFSISSKKDSSKSVPRVKERAQPTETPQLRTSGGTKVVRSISDMFDAAETSEDLLKGLLEMLVDNGPFEKSAIIVVAKDRKSAVVVAARGPNIGNGQMLTLTDPLSPLAQCFSKVRSWGNKESEESPFGSKAFALAPIDADHDTPVALYADCGKNGSITFEARRIFRVVVEILNQKLPHIPGGIPVELMLAK